MHFRRPLLLLGFLVFTWSALAPAPARAQAVSCAGVAAYSATTVYHAGDRVTYQGSLYQANLTIANAPPNYCPACGWWTLLGTCSTSADTTPPTVPTGLTATGITSSSVTLSWNASTDAGGSGLAGYDVFRGGVQVGSSTTTSFTNTGLAASTSYSFTVRARDGAGNVSAQTAPLSVTTAAAGGTCSTLPAAPAAPTASAITSSGVTLSWTAPSAGANCTITGYVVYQNGAQAATPTGTSAAISGLAASTTYSFTVAARNAFGTGPQSPARSVTTAASSGGGGGGTARFAPYADISLAVGENIVADAHTAGLKAVTLAFLVDGGCVATWGGLGGNVSNATFPNGTSVASAISGLSAEGVQVIISWGGALGSIQSSCSTAAQVQAMYQSVFNAYPSIAGQDFDIEGGINNTVVAQALAGLKAANPSKLISLTLPVLPTGLVSAGLGIVNACHAAGFHPDTINVMAMDYGSANDNSGQMGLDATLAAQATHSQTGDNIGITPMIGVNDTNTEIFQLADASTVVSFAKANSYVNRLAFWSLARDNGSCAGQTFASATCSGLSQSTFQFASVFEGF
jgi:chitodextrinase